MMCPECRSTRLDILDREDVWMDRKYSFTCQDGHIVVLHQCPRCKNVEMDTDYED